MTKRCILFALFILVAVCAMAYDFETGGFYFNLIDKDKKIASVVYGDKKYSGDLTIPNTVKYDGKEYTISEIGSNAFEGCTELTSIVINEYIKTIPYYCFSSCTSLKTVSLGNSVEKIGMRSFQGCTKLSSINLNDNIITFNQGAFWGCKSLTKVVIGSSVREMEPAVFSNCTSLKEVEIHEGATIVAEKSFEECTSLTEIKIPNSVLELGSSAFYGCTALESAVIGNKVKEVPYYCFSSCTSLKTVSLGNSVEKIGMRSFQGCTKLSSINLNDNIITFNQGAFWGCKSLTKVVIGSSVREMEPAVFSNCTSLKEVEIHEGATIVAEKSFEECTSLTEIKIPNSVLELGSSAFYGCTALEIVVIGKNIKEVPYYCFAGCTNLKNVSLGSSVNKVGFRAFIGCDNMRMFAVSNTTPPEVGDDAFTDYGATLYVPNKSISAYEAHEIWRKFYKIKDLESSSGDSDIIIFADPEVKRICVTNWDANGDGELSKDEAAAVKELGYVFMGNSKITRFDELQYFVGLKKIDQWTFASSKELYSIVIPNSVTVIESFAFAYCNGLSSLNIPSSVTEIGEYSFQDCYKISAITISNNARKIESGAFAGCYGLKSIIVENGNPVYDSRESCNAIVETASNTLIQGCKNTIIPNNIVTIGDRAFFQCADITSITIPNSVTTIGQFAFCLCSGLTSLNIPKSVKKIKSDAFTRCVSLATIVVDKGNPVYDSRGNCNAIIETSSNRLIIGCKNTIIPEDVVEIGYNAFFRCHDLKKVEIPHGVTKIGYSAFGYCDGLTSITIPNSVLCVEDRAFENCEGLSSVVSLVENPFEIEESVFQHEEYINGETKCYPSSATLYVPAGTLEKYKIFSGWMQFAKVVESGAKETFKEEGITYETQHGNTVAIKVGGDVSGEYEISSSVTHDGVKYVVTIIGEEAFKNNTKLTQVTIPNTIANIGAGAFAGCSRLQIVIIYVENPIYITPAQTRGDLGVFDGIDLSKCTLYVPAGSVDAYKSAQVWKNFGQIKSISTDGISFIMSDDKPVDVYDLRGHKVRSGATSLEGLPKGIYIVNGKKNVK